ncbi:hypothetical protein GCM10010423_70180 [Streptomyces levis]|uniref:Transposase n=1 Tax=Streptomyces levis TaxID=285566 RepID=A0ABN3P3Y4_9ACTN
MVWGRRWGRWNGEPDWAGSRRPPSAACRHQLRAFLEVCGVHYKEHADWLEAWQRAYNAQFYYPTKRLAEAAWPGYRVVEYERFARQGGHGAHGLARRLHARYCEVSRSASWEEDVPLQHWSPWQESQPPGRP